MDVFKVTEFVGTSQQNWADAVDNAVMEASGNFRNILGVEVTNFTAKVVSGRVTEYRASVKIASSFQS